MSMKDALKKAKIAAMKAKDKAKLNPINLTLADIQNLEIANGHGATDEEVLKKLEDIDVDRAGKAKERAQEKLAKGGLSDKEYKIVEAKLQRALVRLSVKG